MTRDGASSDADLRDRITALSAELGFARVGFARAEALADEGARLRAFVGAGRHAAMAWLADTVDVRIDPRRPEMLASARTVVALATPYARAAGEPEGPTPGRFARYARGRDYHNVIGKRMRKLAAVVRAAGHAVRISVDTMPVYERAWAQRAGIGFVGKNCCLIVPGLGSHVLLSILLTSAELEPSEPMAERCGACTLCVEACPTGAFVGPRELDAGRCVSYLTIETRGDVPPVLREGIGDRLFGCDACQDPCPFNRAQVPPPGRTSPFAAHAARMGARAVDVLRMDERAHLAWAEGSPARRAGRVGMARNAALVLGNVGTVVDLPALREAASGDPSEVVREAARWAAERLAREATGGATRPAARGPLLRPKAPRGKDPSR